jgi:hypothetical protein
MNERYWRSPIRFGTALALVSIAICGIPASAFGQYDVEELAKEIKTKEGKLRGEGYHLDLLRTRLRLYEWYADPSNYVVQLPLGDEVPGAELGLPYNEKTWVHYLPCTESELYELATATVVMADLPTDRVEHEKLNLAQRLIAKSAWLKAGFRRVIVDTRDKIRVSESGIQGLQEEDAYLKARKAEEEEKEDSEAKATADAWVEIVEFAIVSATYPKTFKAGEPAKPLEVSYQGDPNFPVSLLLRPRSCPQGFDCASLPTTFSDPPADKRLVVPNALWCHGIAKDWNMDYEVILTDAAGVTTAAFPTPMTCKL